jgi:hypothetical protein
MSDDEHVQVKKVKRGAAGGFETVKEITGKPNPQQPVPI